MKFPRFILTLFVALGLTGPALAMGHGDHGAEKSAPSIVEIATGDDNFSTLVAALSAAGLVETLQGEGPFTVFAPTNDAFAALPEGTVENLLKPENKDQLTAVLLHHVVAGKVMSGDIAGKTLTVESVGGSSLDIDATSGVVIDGATVTGADVNASNGVVHVIDAVMLP